MPRKRHIRIRITTIAIAAILSTTLNPVMTRCAAQGPVAEPGKTSKPSPGSEKESILAGAEVVEIPLGKLHDGMPRVTGSLAPEYLGTTLTREAEPNGTSATSTPIAGASARIRGDIYQNGDIDFYSFTATAGDRVYAATMTSFSSNGSVDSVLDLIGTDGLTVLETDNDDGVFGPTASSIAGTTLASAGTYFLRVRHVSAANQLRPYDLHFRLRGGSPSAEVEPNNTTSTAQPLPASGWVAGSTSSAADADFYSFNLNAGDTVYLSLDLDPERDTVEWNGQLGMGLFGSPASTLSGNDAGSATPDSEAFFMSVKRTGTYFIFVGIPVAGTTFGTYHLSATVFPRVSPGTCATYTSANVPVVIPDDPAIVTSTLTVPGNPRIDKLRVNIEIKHNFMADLDVQLTSPNGTTISLFSDAGSIAAGVFTTMDLTVDDDAGSPLGIFSIVEGPAFMPESTYRLAWFDGMDAGGTWTLTVRDDEAGDGGTLDNWSLEICEDTTPLCDGAPTTVFGTDFEANNGGFTHSGTQDEWEYGLPTFAPIDTANSGANCWKTDLDGTYQNSSNQELFSPAIALPVTTPLRLSWAQKYQLESASFDHMFVEVREVGGGGLIRRIFEHREADMVDTVGNPNVVIQEASGWGIQEADISAFAGLNVQVVFHVDSDTTVQRAGLAIDDFLIETCGAPCTITCPANITATGTAVPGSCGFTAVVTYAPPAADNCPGVTSVCVPASGSTFNEGVTTVTCTATDAVGNMASCSFTVTVGSDFDFCAFGNNGDTFHIVTDLASPSYGYWRYHIAATNTTLCGTANFIHHVPGIKLRAYDNNYSAENPVYFMDASFNATTGTVYIRLKSGQVVAFLRDYSLLNNPVCN